ncbi:MAG TPA: cation:proton antiporter, partial [Ignisphaera sp.]|nr:cation:proton antiporter [Ignisphaera sp.]
MSIGIEQSYLWLLEVALLIMGAKLLEAIFIRIGLARILAYLSLGLILAVLRHSTGFEISDVTIALANIGIISLLFQAGLESTLRHFIRGIKEAGIVAVGGVIGALVAGFALIPLLCRSVSEAFALGVVLSATSISVTVKTFEELGALGSPEAQVIIGAAVVDDVIGLALLSILYGMSLNELDVVHSIGIPILAFSFWFATAWLANRYAPNLFKFILKLRLEAGITSLAFAIVLFLAYIASTIGLSTILLAYAFGLGIAGFRYVARKIEEALRVLTSIFAPLFFIYVGSRIDIEQILLSEPTSLLM